MTDKEEAAAQPDEDEAAIPTSEDGIPLVVNGVRLTAVQIQALREARSRRAAIDAAAELPPERGGPDRPEEPTRYGDW